MFLQVLRDKPLEDVVQQFLATHAEARITLRDANHLLSLPSRVLDVAPGRICLLDPGELEQSYQWQAAQPLTLTIWLRNMKHMMASTFLERGKAKEKNDDRPAVVLELPKVAYQVSGRLAQRVTVPSSEHVRCVFWPGSLEMDRSWLPVMPAWSGGVIDLSSGGMQVRAHAGAAKLLRTREVVGVEVTFGAAEKTITLNAHFCYARPEDANMSLCGFAFAADESAYAAAKDILAKKIEQYAKM